MDSALLVKNKIEIDAPASKVWEILVAPKYIRQWDDLPADFGDYYLELGMVISWMGNSRLTVIECEPYERLKLSLYAEKWELPPASYDVNYFYLISGSGTGVILELQIGDFSSLPDGETFYKTAEAFAATALEKIKNLSENRL